MWQCQAARLQRESCRGLSSAVAQRAVPTATRSSRPPLRRQHRAGRLLLSMSEILQERLPTSNRWRLRSNRAAASPNVANLCLPTKKKKKKKTPRCRTVPYVALKLCRRCRSVIKPQGTPQFSCHSQWGHGSFAALQAFPCPH